MATINLREYYPYYPNDKFVEVPDELAMEMKQWQRDENAYKRKRRWNHATYSLDYGDGIENSILFVADSPNVHYEKKLTYEQLLAALSTIPSKQAKRIFAHFFCGQSKAEIARTENVGTTAVWISIRRGLNKLAELLKEFDQQTE